MKKCMSLIAILFVMSFALIACSNDDGSADDDHSNSTENEESNRADQENNSEDDNESQDKNEPNKVDKGAAHGDWGEDELGLGIGDTATFSSNFVMAEITLDSVEQIEDEEAYYGQYTILHMTVINIGDEPAEFEDIFDSTELSDSITEDLDGGELWEDVNLKDNSSEVGIEEEVSGSLVYDVEKEDKYEVYMNFGLESTSNKITFEFDSDEME